VVASRNSLALAYTYQGRYQEAETEFRAILAIERRHRGDEQPRFANLLANLGLVFHQQEQYGEAEQLYRQALAIHQETKSGKPAQRATILGRLAEALTELDRSSEAEPLARESLQLWRELGYSEEHLNFAMAELRLGSCRAKLGGFEEAEHLLVHGYRVLEQHTDLPSDVKQLALRHLVELYRSWNKPDRAAHYQAMLSSSSDLSIEM